MVSISVITGLSVFWILAAILLILVVWLIIKMATGESENDSVINRIRTRYFKGEIEDDNVDERLHHLI
jgi:uncharacterized membrane protein